MKSKRLISLLIVVAMIFCMTFTLVSTVSATDYDVELFYASAGGTDPFYCKGYVRVRDMGNPKTVTVHYTYDGSNWYDQSASYVEEDPNDSNFDVWYFKTPDTTIATSCTFAIKYEVNGNTYWDNNGGNNHCVATYNNYNYQLERCVVISGLRGTYFGGTTFWGDVILEDLGYNKEVKVYYSLYVNNSWTAFTSVSASYNADMQYNQEKWTFTTSTTSATQVKYYVVYKDLSTNITYTDDNFDRDYYINRYSYGE